MKYYAALLLFVLFSPVAQSATKTYHCINCSDLQMKQLAESVSPSGDKDIAYVFNTEREIVRTYEVRKQKVDDVIENVVANEITTPTNVSASYQSYLQARENVLSTFTYTDGQSSLRYSQNTTSNTSTYSCKAESAIGNVDVNNTAASAHKFIHDGTLREGIFSEIANRSHVWSTYASAFMTLNNSVSGVLKLDDMLFRLRFANGSSVVVTPSRYKDSIDYSSDSGLDSDCNNIPSDPTWSGQFTFTSLENYHAMKDYLWYLNVNWIQEFDGFDRNGACTIVTKCRQEENRLTCYSSMQCD